MVRYQMVVILVVGVVGIVAGIGIGWVIAEKFTVESLHRLELSEQRAVSAKSLALDEAYRERSRREEVETLNNRLVSEMAGLATRPPHVIDPSPTIRAIAEAITSAYGSPAVPDPTTPEYERTPDFSKLQPATTTTPDQQWFPDVEMDEWLENTQGYPTRGGWVNRSTNSQEPLPDGQLPVHRLLDDGSVERMDSQPMFRAGDGQAVTPPGGIE